MATSVKTLTIDPSPSEDVIAYRMYYVPPGEQIITETEDPNAPSAFVDLDDSLTYDLKVIAGIGNLDGEFDVGFTAFDDAGWESELGGINKNVPFDFVPPEAPAGATFGVG